MNKSNSEFVARTEMMASIIAAYVSNNSLPIAEVSNLIASIYSVVAKISGAQTEVVVLPRKEPAVAIKKSVTKDFIICLEDGEKFKSLKRHLASSYGMTPDDYRTKWQLPADYPMVAPAYSEKRSQLAKDIGLGVLRPKRPASPQAKAPPGRPKKTA